MNLELPRPTDERKHLDKVQRRRQRRREVGRRFRLRWLTPTVGGQRKLRRTLTYVERRNCQNARILALSAMCDGHMRLIPMWQFGIAFMLMGDHLVDALLYCARDIDLDWFDEALGNALLTKTGRVRSFNSASARHRLRYLGLHMLFQQDGQTLGIPVGVYRALLGDWQQLDDGPKFVKLGRRTVYGYLQEMREAGLISAVQPPAFDLPPWCRGRHRLNDEGLIEVWAFNQYRLLGAWQRETPLEPQAETEEAYHEWVVKLQLQNLKPREGHYEPPEGVERSQGGRSPPSH